MTNRSDAPDITAILTPAIEERFGSCWTDKLRVYLDARGRGLGRGMVYAMLTALQQGRDRMVLAHEPGVPRSAESLQRAPCRVAARHLPRQLETPVRASFSRPTRAAEPSGPAGVDSPARRTAWARTQ